jgi:hypothetical protein
VHREPSQRCRVVDEYDEPSEGYKDLNESVRSGVKNTLVLQQLASMETCHDATPIFSRMVVATWGCTHQRSEISNLVSPSLLGFVGAVRTHGWYWEG